MKIIEELYYGNIDPHTRDILNRMIKQSDVSHIPGYSEKGPSGSKFRCPEARVRFISRVGQMWVKGVSREWGTGFCQLKIGHFLGQIIFAEILAPSSPTIRLVTFLSIKKPKAEEKSSAFELVGEGGFEPPKALPADLQSVPFGHSGIPPYSVSGGGAGRRTRTPDLLITNQLLYQLSYTS